MAKQARQFWLMKSEPDVFSFDDLWKAPKRRTMWDGIRNYQARNFMRDVMRIGDGVLYYHSNAKPAGIAGIAKVASKPYADPTQFDPNDSHFDPKADPEHPTWMLVDIQAVKKGCAFVPLDELKGHPKLGDMVVTRRGSRLSVQPVQAAEWKVCLGLLGLDPTL